MGFEPTVGYSPTPVFETGTLNRTQTTLQKKYGISAASYMAQRVGFEPTVGYSPTPIFKTGAINQLDHLCILYMFYITILIY